MGDLRITTIPSRKDVYLQSASVNVPLIDMLSINACSCSLQNFFLACRSSERLLQLTRMISYEVTKQQSSRFIVYFATCACVDYFYRVCLSVSRSVDCLTYLSPFPLRYCPLFYQPMLLFIPYMVIFRRRPVHGHCQVLHHLHHFLPLLLFFWLRMWQLADLTFLTWM